MRPLTACRLPRAYRAADCMQSGPLLLPTRRPWRSAAARPEPTPPDVRRSRRRVLPLDTTVPSQVMRARPEGSVAAGFVAARSGRWRRPRSSKASAGFPTAARRTHQLEAVRGMFAVTVGGRVPAFAAAAAEAFSLLRAPREQNGWPILVQGSLVAATAQAKRHLRRYNGRPRRSLHLFLAERAWRFDRAPASSLLHRACASTALALHSTRRRQARQPGHPFQNSPWVPRTLTDLSRRTHARSSPCASRTAVCSRPRSEPPPHARKPPRCRSSRRGSAPSSSPTAPS